jgi:hypothetical protein
MMSGRLNADAGQLLVLLDNDQFARAMRRYRSDRWRENCATFESPTTDAAFEVKQWENKKAQLRTKKTQLPVVNVT